MDPFLDSAAPPGPPPRAFARSATRPVAVLVTGCDHALGRGLARGLVAEGHRVGAHCADPDAHAVDGALPVAGSLDSQTAAGAVVRMTRGMLGGLDAVVHAAIAPSAASADAADGPPTLDRFDADGWAAAVETPIRRALWVVQAAVAAGVDRIIVCAPTSTSPTSVAGTGAAALRALGLATIARSAAQEFGPAGMRANVLAVDPANLADMPGAIGPGGGDGAGVSASRPALGHCGDPMVDLAPLVSQLLGDGALFLTGAVVPADGGRP